ncbi:hypothetical protein ACQKGC_26935 [Allorhizobium pseudoryzae]|uniref:hypothetical protein n=1 Tax=Allorhizobium pseudoryzae TaxID=379684 RepID=UPI003D07FF11
MHEAVYSALRMATGGYPTDTLIVTKDEEGNPMVSMFVLDGDMQLFRVFYDAEDGIEFKINQMENLLLSRPQLELISKMRVLADIKWKQLQRYWVSDKATWEGYEDLLDTPDGV